MKTVLVISDTHGRKENLDALSRLMEESDYIVHLGDGRADMREIEEKYPEKTYVLKGNCDLCGGLREAEIEIEGVKIFACHGDLYRVKSETYTLLREAKERGADVALYGHTHNAEITESDGVTLVCPGTMKFPLYRGGTYAYLVITGTKCVATIVGEEG